MPIIESIDVCAAAVPLDKVTSFSNRSVSTRHYGLVKVRSAEGVEGIGFCYVGSAGAGLFPEAVELLSRVVIGEDPYRVEGLWQQMYQEALLQGRAGTVLRALSAIDNALWDRNARAAGLPLYKYLGSAVNDRVPAYASGGYFLDGKTPADLALLPAIASRDDTEWLFHDANGTSVTVPLAPRMRSPNASLRLQAAVAGLGVARITATYCEAAVAAGRLVRLLPAFDCDPLRMYALLPGRQRLPARVRVFLQALAPR